MDNETVSLWNKTAEELTVGENLKVAVVWTAGVMAAYVAVVGGIAVGAHLFEKFQERKFRKAQEAAEKEG